MVGYDVSGITLGPLTPSGIQDAIQTEIAGIRSGATIHVCNIIPQGNGAAAQAVIVYEAYK